MMPDAGAQGEVKMQKHCMDVFFFVCFKPVFCSLLLFMLRPPHIKPMENMVLPRILTLTGSATMLYRPTGQ